jgi:hypothetical protein
MEWQVLVLENNRLDMDIRQGFSAATAQGATSKASSAGIQKIPERNKEKNRRGVLRLPARG